ncbi:MAG: hypothetical protein AAF713_01305 [Pseudomonadota bacterium]
MKLLNEEAARPSGERASAAGTAADFEKSRRLGGSLAHARWRIGIARQPGFFDFDERMRRLTDLGDWFET